MIELLKNKKRKVILTIFVTVIFCLFNGCSDFLEKEPLGKLSESVFNTKDAVDKLVIACYSPLNGFQAQALVFFNSSPENTYICDMRSGNTHKGTTPGDGSHLNPLERHEIPTDNLTVGRKWRLMYGGIDRCNDVLKVLNDFEIKNLSQAEKSNIVAEVRFLRAYYHFELKKIYNMVPYIDETVTDPQKRVPNDRDIWPNIESDYSYAVDNLPDYQEELGRPTKLAAMASLAYVYLFQHKYNEAKDLLDLVIASGKYQLAENFYDNFDPEKNHNREVIWSNETAVNVPGASLYRGNRGADLAHPNAPDEPNLSGAGFNCPTFDLVNAYKTDENGLPLINSYYENTFKHDMGIESSDEFQPDTITPVDPRLDWTVGRRGVPYHDWGIHPGKKWIRDQAYSGPYNQKKWVIRKSQLEKYSYNNTAKFNATTVKIIRYAAVLLWAAECEVEVGDPEKAREYVNMIRERARDGYYVRLGDNAPFGDGKPAANYKIDVYTESWAGKSKDWIRDRVRFENRLELALEGHHFFNLIRWDIAEEYINAYIARESKLTGYLGGAAFEKTDRYFPIPLTEIDRSYKDGQPTLIQNPGY